MTATRQGLFDKARAIDAPTWKQRHGCGPGGSRSDSFAGIFSAASDGRIGLPCAAVSANTARMGDGRSTYFDGVISAANKLATAKGVREGQTAKEAADILLRD